LSFPLDVITSGNPVSPDVGIQVERFLRWQRKRGIYPLVLFTWLPKRGGIRATGADNDERGALKNKINALFGSELVL
jgi:hypothetical protein